MEDLYVGNLANDTTQQEILVLLGLDGTTYLRENNLARMLCPKNRRFNWCMHVRMPQQFTERFLGLSALNFKSRDFVIHLLTEMIKSLLGGKRNNVTSYGGLSFPAKPGEIFLGAGQVSTRQKNSQQQPRECKAGTSNPTEGAPGEQVWVDNVEAPARAKTLMGRILLI